MEIQTRSERNGLKYFTTLKQAFDHAEQDLSVWKISFSLPDGERVRLVKNDHNEFKYEPII